MSKAPSTHTPTLAELPADELAIYARDLGLTMDASAPRASLLGRIRKQQELLIELDRDALLAVVVWARIPVRRSASKEELAKHIAHMARFRFDGLSEQGLRAVARLRGINPNWNDSRESIEQKIRQQESLWDRLKRKRRSAVGSLITSLIESPDDDSQYQFLPEDQEHASTSLKESIEHAGVVGGIAKKLRGAADEYIYEKLEEIEQRIDAKLCDIDDRMAIWRDREVANRLRIIKITLIASIVVALISLGYNYLKPRLASSVQQTATQPTKAWPSHDLSENE